MDNLKSMVYFLYDGLRHWEKLGWKKIPYNLYKGQMVLINKMYSSSGNAPTDLYQFIKLLYQPFKDWNIPELEQLFPLDSSFLVKDFGITVEVEDFIDMFISPEEDQQSKVKQILLHCRKYNMNEEYLEIRSILSNPQYAVLPAIKLKKLLKKVSNEQLRKLLNECYEETPHDIHNYKKCPYCGWTLENINGHWKCNKEDVCRYFASYEKLSNYPFNETDIVYRLTAGVQKFTLLTGMVEKQIFNRLAGYKPVLYPNIDRYDISVTIRNKIYNLDVKDYRTPNTLATFLNERMREETSKYNDNLYIVIPDYRIKQNRSYKELLCSKLQPDLSSCVLTEKELYKKLREEAD